LLYPDKLITFRNIEKFVPNLHRSKKYVNSMQTRRFIKTHYLLLNAFPKTIYIYRDGRDTLASFYTYDKQRNNSRGDFSKFLKQRLFIINRYETVLPWHIHVSRAVNFSQKHPERVLLLQYEKLKDSPIEEVRKIVSFCGLHCSDEDIGRAAEKTSFTNLQQIEKQYGPERIKYPQVKFFRSGRSGDWKNFFSPKDEKLFLSKAGRIMRKLNYID